MHDESIPPGYRLTRARNSSQFPFHVVAPGGLPDRHLTLFATSLAQEISEATAAQYVRELLKFVQWLETSPVPRREGWSLYKSSFGIQEAFRTYLICEAHCKVGPRTDELGLKVLYVKIVDSSIINVRALLTVLKRFYYFLKDRGFVSFENPFVRSEYKKELDRRIEAAKASFVDANRRGRMPTVSGVDSPWSTIRLSSNYFRLVANDWKPQTINDPAFASRVLGAGEHAGWSLREKIVSRILFESGARISEICSMCLRDWWTTSFLNGARVRDKGSGGVPVKDILWSSTTTKLLHRYFSDPDERPRCCGDSIHLSSVNAALRRDVNNPVGDSPVFVTKRQTALSPDYFRRFFWQPALRAVGLDADPHQARHWFVTTALNGIAEDHPNDPEARERERKILVQYMAWKSGERMLEIYDHSAGSRELQSRLASIHAVISAKTKPSNPSDGLAHVNKSMSEEMAFVLGLDSEE